MRSSLACVVSALVVYASAASHKPNILFLASDDMRPEMSPYGHDYMQTPHFQTIADDGFTFRRSYVQYALCAPSRTVILTGRRPDSSRVWKIGPYFRETTGRDWTSLPQFFRRHGWRAIGHGKIFHEGEASGGTPGHAQKDDQDQKFGAWSVPFYHPDVIYDKFDGDHPDPSGGYCVQPLIEGAVDKPWQTFNDAKSTLAAIEWIKNASAYVEPFFLAVGFHRPHTPYIYPKEFEFQGDVAFPPENYYITKDVPDMAPHDWTSEGSHSADLWVLNITDHDFIKNKSSLCDAVPFWKQRAMKKSYLSCIQYVDHLVGLLLGALREEGLYEETLIVFWGDHGYKTGEHCDWFKHDNYETATRIPLLVKPAAGGSHGFAPGGRMLEQLVESVDIFPSMVELAGLAVPAELEGQSFAPLLRDPGASGKGIIFWQYDHGNFMGYAVRGRNWRYTEWVPFSCSGSDPMSNCAASRDVAPRWSEVVARELYDHTDDNSTDFLTENTNLAHLPKYADIVARMHDSLVKHWVPAAPGATAIIV